MTKLEYRKLLKVTTSFLSELAALYAFTFRGDYATFGGRGLTNFGGMGLLLSGSSKRYIGRTAT